MLKCPRLPRKNQTLEAKSKNQKESDFVLSDRFYERFSNFNQTNVSNLKQHNNKLSFFCFFLPPTTNMVILILTSSWASEVCQHPDWLGIRQPNLSLVKVQLWIWTEKKVFQTKEPRPRCNGTVAHDILRTLKPSKIRAAINTVLRS